MTTPDIAALADGLTDRQLAAVIEGRVRECYVNHPVGTRCPNCVDWPFKKGGAADFISTLRAHLEAREGKEVMALSKHIRSQLPKARLVSVKWVNRWPWDYRTRSPFFIKWRNANAIGMLFGPVQVIVRAAWLEHAARALHPELFEAREGRGI